MKTGRCVTLLGELLENPHLADYSTENYFSGWDSRGYLLELKLGLFLRGLERGKRYMALFFW